MSEVKIPDFDVWCREFPAGSTADRISARNSAISALLEKHGERNLDVLLRLAFSLSPSSIPGPVSEIRTALHGADPTFAQSANDRELQVMAAAALNALASRDGYEAAFAATRCLTTSFCGLRSTELPVDLVDFCAKRVKALGVETRKRSEGKRNPLNLRVSKYPTLASDDEITAEGMTKLAQEVIDAVLASTSTGIRSTFNQSSIFHRLAVLEEELQILWWLTNQWCESLDTSFDDLAESARGIVLGKEIADQTQIFPEPPSLKGLLHRSNVRTDELKVSDAINSLDGDWCKTLLEGKEANAYFTPLHFAVQRRIEADNDKTWAKGWASAVGVAEASKLRHIDIGVQMFRETLILKQK